MRSSKSLGVRLSAVLGHCLCLGLSLGLGPSWALAYEGCGETAPPEISIHCGAAPTVVFDRDGRLWAAFEQDGHVVVNASDDLGETFTKAVRVNVEPERVETNGENRPKIVLGPGRELFVTWTMKAEGRFNGDIRFSRSLDRGRSFEPPRTLNDDGLLTGHRFDSLHVDESGDIYVVWIDKRDREAAKKRGEDFQGASIYYAVSTDRGASFATNKQVAEQACECCRIAITEASGGGVGIFWRHLFDDNIRDHAFATLGTKGPIGPVQRPSVDGWQINACPHHGPTILPAKNDSYHLAWFTAAGNRPVVHYGRFDPSKGELEHPTRIATAVPAAHPHLARSQGRLLIAWKGMQDKRVKVYLKTSEDEGATWSASRVIADTGGASDHPFLLSRGAQTFLSWQTKAEGWRLIPLFGANPAGTDSAGADSAGTDSAASDSAAPDAAG